MLAAMKANKTGVLAGLPGTGEHSETALAGSRSSQTHPAERHIRILLADDHPVVRRGISACLSHHEHLSIIGEASNGQEALRKARELSPDLILMDIDMPQMSGLAVTEVLRKELPNIKVLILSMHTNTEYIMRIIQSGARGFVLKESSTEELIKAIEAVDGGEAYFSAEVARIAFNKFVGGTGDRTHPKLTPREEEILVLIADGHSNKEIASQLGVGVRTVETHRERIMQKLDIHTVAGLTKFAITKGLVPLNQ